jgi:hypothetical protein
MKRVLAAMLCMSMLMVGSTTAYAQDIGSFGDGGFGDSATSTMTYDIDSSYIVSIPATINMNQENKLTSNMMDIRSNEIVEVYTDSTVQMQNQNNMEASPMDMEIVTSNTELTYNGSPIVAQFLQGMSETSLSFWGKRPEAQGSAGHYEGTCEFHIRIRDIN